jgi:hypothetical protein
MMDDVEKAKEAIAHAASEALRVIECAKVEAVRVNNTKENNDHDLLIRIETRMQGLKEDINEIKNTASLQITDHESRLKKLENKTSNYFITITLYSIAVAGIIGLVIYQIVNK